MPHRDPDRRSGDGGPPADAAGPSSGAGAARGAAPGLAERLLTLPLRHQDLVHPDDVVEAFARDLADELGADVAVRPIGDDGEDDAGAPAAATTLPVAVDGRCVARLDLVREAPLDEQERRLLDPLMQLLDDRLTHAAQREESRLLTELTVALGGVERLEKAAERALDVLLAQLGAEAGRALRRENSGFRVLAANGAWSGDEREEERRLRLADACLRGSEPFVAHEDLLAFRLGAEPPYRSVLLLRFPPRMTLHRLRWPALLRAGRALVPHLVSLWHAEVQDELLEVHGGSWDQPPEELYETLLGIAIQFVHGSDSGSLLVRQGRDGPFVFRAVRGFADRALAGISLSEEEVRAWYGPDEVGWRRGRPRIVRTDRVDIPALSRRGGMRTDGVETGAQRILANLCLPVLHEGAVMAVLNLDNQHDAQAFGRDSRAVVELFGPPLAGILHRHHTQDLLRRAALTDDLTQLGNRRMFNDVLRRELARHDRSGALLSVLVMDMSGFKAINDELGHAVGDEALVRIAATLRDHVRDSDVMSRWGGDEFAAVLVDASPAEAAAAAVRLRGAVAGIEIEGRRLRINVGAASVPSDGTDAEELVALADRRMYQDKRRDRASR